MSEPATRIDRDTHEVNLQDVRLLAGSVHVWRCEARGCPFMAPDDNAGTLEAVGHAVLHQQQVSG